MMIKSDEHDAALYVMVHAVQLRRKQTFKGIINKSKLSQLHPQILGVDRP